MERVGWIGTGVMGASMCGHLVSAGHRATVFTRTAAKADALVARGAKRVDSPRAVAESSDVVFVMVGFPADVREVVLGERGALAGAVPGTLLVDMTTSEPELAREIEREAIARGVGALDAPVSGGDVGAREARLSIMVGGLREHFERAQPLFERMGRTIVHQGPAGAGQQAKLVNQVLVASGMVGICEALLFASRAGLDPETVLASVAGGAAGSWALSNLGPRILRRDFAPGFLVEHFVKDLAIAVAEARRMELDLPGLALAERLYRELLAQGHARSGTQALVLALAKLSGIEA
ncbi:NAD(P)-dependent oxidoreductase [bacterium]|nr:NAD(P)-dependent oxidoreductase [bacterium]